MSEGKHTKGPWEALPHERFYIPIAHRNNESGAISGVLARVVARKTWIEESRANARLIAAAPDLVAACEAALNSLEYINNAHPNTTGSLQHNEAIDSLRLALKKARG